MYKLGLISDPHAYPKPVAEAISIFKKEQVDAIWCTGDFAGYGEGFEETLHLLQDSNCNVIVGNHELDYLKKNVHVIDVNIKNYLLNLPKVIQQNIENKKVYMVHASPPESLMEGIRLLDQKGEVIAADKKNWSEQLVDFSYDVLIIGHTHQVFAEVLGSTLVINPGSSQFNHSCAILSLPDLTVQWFSLSAERIKKSWNWGMEVRKS